MADPGNHVYSYTIADELLVRYARENRQQTSVESYWKWNEDICNSNYIYMQQIVFTFLYSMMLFRTGIRNIDLLTAESGKGNSVNCSTQEIIRGIAG